MTGADAFGTNRSDSPRDLAAAVYSELLRREKNSPDTETLTELFETMFFASLQTEESQQVRFHLVYLDPRNPDPKPPPYPPHDRWSCVALSEPIPLESKNFIKMAGASDPRTSSFAVYKDKSGRLVAWGLIDQGNRYYDYVNFESERGPERPGLFQASITGLGHLVAHVGYEKIAELRQNRLIRAAVDVFGKGPIVEILRSGVHSRFRNKPADDLPIETSDWQQELTAGALASVRRLLLRVQNIHHGGALLVTPDSQDSDLSVKYGIKYDRLRRAIERHEQMQAAEFFAGSTIIEDYLDKTAENIPADLYLDEVVSTNELEHIRAELRSVIWFIALLTRVDGLVLLNPGLEVLGFGVEITASEEPTNIFVANDLEVTEATLRRVEYHLYGTRHRSMMRYCAKHPGSVGFVVSQDGDVRIMTHVGERLVMWENIRLQLPTFVRPEGRGKRGSRRRG